MKKISILIIVLITLVLAGCTKAIPEGPIKDFVDKLDYDLAYQQINTGKSIITATYYVDDQVDGQVTSTTYIDKTNLKYHYITTDVVGSFVGTDSGKYNYQNQEILCYMNEDSTTTVYKKTDDVSEEIKYNENDVNVSINNFFYLESEANYHRGGVYYGDYIIANCAKYYSCFSLDETKKELSYEVNTSSVNSAGDEIVTMHKFTVNEYGMILTLSSKSIYLAKNIVMETTISCEYNIPIEKKVVL